MNVVRITSASNPAIKLIKSLHDKKGRQKEKSVLLEGIRLVADAANSGALIRYFVVSESYFEKSREIISKYHSEKVIVLTDELFGKVSETEAPQGLIAVARIPCYNEDEILSRLKRLIVLERIQDPGNAGTIIRTADAFGFDAVILSGDSVDPFNSKVVRSTMGSLFHIPVVVSEDIYSTINKIKDKSIPVIAAHPRDGRSCWNVDLSSDVAIVIGNEGNGLTNKMLELSDEVAMIPMTGLAESLNASSAASVLIYESMRQKLMKQEHGPR
ncbi:MAG: RNA methyltransferase [Clostridiaceae bacterium]|nr:RNA methyltransferase [Clostridiaceae bacterium]